MKLTIIPNKNQIKYSQAFDIARTAKNVRVEKFEEHIFNKLGYGNIFLLFCHSPVNGIAVIASYKKSLVITRYLFFQRKKLFFCNRRTEI